MVIVEYGGWEMLVPAKVAEVTEERAKVVEALRMISEIETDGGKSE